MFLKDLEQIIKDKYQDQSEQIDHDALWGKVYPEIKKDKKRPFILWLLGTGIIALVIGFWIWSSAPTTVSTPAISSVSLDNQEHENEIVNEVKELKAIVQDLKESVQDINEKVVVPNKIPGTNIDQSVNLGSKELEVVNSSSDVFKANKPDFKFQPVKEVENISFSTNPNFKPLVRNIASKKSSPSSFAELKIEKLDLLALSGIDHDDREFDSFYLSVQDKPKNSSSLLKPSFDFLLAYGFVSRSLETSDRNWTDALIQRSGNEDPLEALSIDLFINIPLSSKLLIRAGLDYQMITERTQHYFETSDIITSDNTIIGTYEDENGVVTTFYGTGEVLVENKINRTSYNYFHSIGLPIQMVVAHQFNRLRLEVGAGIRLSKLFKKQGYLQYVSNEEYVLDSDQLNFFNPSLNLDLLADFGWSYKLNEKLSWTTRIQYSYGLNGVNSSNNPIEQKYNLLKIKTGLRYQF